MAFHPFTAGLITWNFLRQIQQKLWEAQSLLNRSVQGKPVPPGPQASGEVKTCNPLEQLDSVASQASAQKWNGY